MNIKVSEWDNYRTTLSKLNKKAAADFVEWTYKHGGLVNIERQLLLDYVVALVTKYGEGSAALATEFYDEIAKASGKAVPGAVPAETLSFGEIAKAVNGTIKESPTEEMVASTIGRLIKQSSADTMLKNARRDHIEFAWIPVGKTCAFCLMLASNGWQNARKLRTDHAEHIHANCDCNYVVRFSSNDDVEGYNPEEYRKMYQDAEGKTSRQKLNYMRREQYAENKDEINEQKRMAYASRKERDDNSG